MTDAGGRERNHLITLLSLGLALLITGCGSLSTQIQQGYQAQVAYAEGLQRYNAGDYAGAIPSFRRVVTLNPTFDEAEANLAWSYYYLGNYPEATVHFRQALTLQPWWEGLHNGLGWSRYRTGRYHIALQAFQEALDLVPTYRDAAIGSAFSLFELGRYQEALPRLERLTREGEGTPFRKPATDVEEVRSRYAWSLFYLGEHEKARREFAKGTAARPEWYGLHNGMGWTLLRLGNRAEARASFRQALQLKPDYPDAKEGLAQAEL